jgi:intracellular sulfur oxidation DsrE/DsrF family protein
MKKQISQLSKIKHLSIMKKLLFILVLATVTFTCFAQQKPNVILHLQSSDTAVYKSTVNQIANLKKEIPQARIELVCHGPGLDFLLIKKSKYANKVNALDLRDVQLVGCEFAMAQKNIRKEDLVPFATTVPSGVAEIVKKQQDNWLYVKMGF